MNLRAKAFVQRALATPALPAASLLAGLVFVFEPAQVYQLNRVFIYFPLSYALPVLVLAALLLAALLAGLANLGGARWKSVAATVLGGLAVAAWGTAAFLTTTHGALDGGAMTPLPQCERLVRDAGFVLLALAGGALTHFWPKIAGRLMAALVLVLSGHVAWVAFTHPQGSATTTSHERIATLSSQRNVLVLVMDTFQNDFFAEILKHRPQLARSFRGFTYFENAVGHAPTTFLSIPPLHSGVPVDTDVALAETYARHVGRDSFLAQLARRDYDALLLNPMATICPQGVACVSQEMVSEYPGEAVTKAAAFLATFGLFRVAPESLKSAVISGFDPAARDVRTSFETLRELAANARAGSAKSTVRFLHLLATHPPAQFDADCKPVSSPPWSRDIAIAQDACAVSILAQLFARLETLGLYDKTAIIVVADHGTVPAEPVEAQWREAASPLLLVKPFGAREPLRKSSRLVGLVDVAATVCAWTGDCKVGGGTDVMGPAKETASYPFNAYMWNHKYWLEDRVPISDSFMISGPPRDPKSWKRLKKADEPPVTHLDFSEEDPPRAFRRGWSHLEEGVRRWGIGQASEVELDLPKTGALTLEMQATTHPRNAGQVITVLVNGTRVGAVKVPPQLTKLAVTIPAGLATGSDDVVTLQYSKWATPAPGDPRELAVLFYQIDIVGDGAPAEGARR